MKSFNLITRRSLMMAVPGVAAASQVMPVPSAALGTLTVHGARIYYSNGTKTRIGPTGNLLNQWRSATSSGIACVVLFFTQRYDVYINGVKTTRPYVHVFNGAAGDGDYYWFTGTVMGAGLVTDVPPGLPSGAAKTGVMMADSAFWPMYNTAKEDYVL